MISHSKKAQTETPQNGSKLPQMHFFAPGNDSILQSGCRRRPQDSRILNLRIFAFWPSAPGLEPKDGVRSSDFSRPAGSFFRNKDCLHLMKGSQMCQTGGPKVSFLISYLMASPIENALFEVVWVVYLTKARSWQTQTKLFYIPSTKTSILELGWGSQVFWFGRHSREIEVSNASISRRTSTLLEFFDRFSLLILRVIELNCSGQKFHPSRRNLACAAHFCLYRKCKMVKISYFKKVSPDNSGTSFHFLGPQETRRNSSEDNLRTALHNLRSSRWENPYVFTRTCMVCTWPVPALSEIPVRFKFLEVINTPNSKSQSLASQILVVWEENFYRWVAINEFYNWSPKSTI